MQRIELEGAIAGVGFASGHRFVIGLWDRGPLGPMQDIMWARPDGTRVLLTPSEEVAGLIAGIYSFEDVRVVPFHVARRTDGFTVIAGSLYITAQTGRPLRLFSLRPRFVRRSYVWTRLEDILFRRLVGRLALKGARGVRAFGTTPKGQREWYRIDAYRPILQATGMLQGSELGALQPVRGKLGFGFSEFPERPAYVECSPVVVGDVGAPR